MSSSIAFIALRWLDVLDILLVALLLYQLYHLIKGTAAIRIFVGILFILVLWRFTVALQMELVSSILGQFIGIGVIAVIIIFQPEIRAFLIKLGSNSLWQAYFKDRNWRIPLFQEEKVNHQSSIQSVVKSTFAMAEEKVGALVILQRKNELENIINTGQALNAELSSQLLNSIFQKNSPLHDGAIIIANNVVKATRVILPVNNEKNIPARFGLRHRAAIGVTEKTDALAIVVSEETGQVSYIKNGEFIMYKNTEELTNMIKEDLN
jgi:uncharacterized protein (TIGR00159 family)